MQEHTQRKKENFLNTLHALQETTPQKPTEHKAYFHALHSYKSLTPTERNKNAINDHIKQVFALWLHNKHEIRNAERRINAINYDSTRETTINKHAIKPTIPHAERIKDEGKYKHLNKKKPLIDINIFVILKLLYSKHAITKATYKDAIQRAKANTPQRQKIQEHIKIYIRTITKTHKGKNSISALQRQEIKQQDKQNEYIYTELDHTPNGTIYQKKQRIILKTKTSKRIDKLLITPFLLPATKIAHINKIDCELLQDIKTRKHNYNLFYPLQLDIDTNDTTDTSDKIPRAQPIKKLTYKKPLLLHIHPIATNYANI
jgi:hypothetical protein